MTKDAKLIKKNCVGSRCNGTFRVSKGKGEQQQFCSRMCKVIHKGYNWEANLRKKTKPVLATNSELACHLAS